MSWRSGDENCPDQWDFVKVEVRVTVYNEKPNSFETEETDVTVHREEQTDMRAIRDALNRSDVEDIELI